MMYQELAAELLSTLEGQKLPTDDYRQLHSGETGILNYLSRNGGHALAGVISREVGITTGRTAIALKSLEKKGMITRVNSETDRRNVIVHVTESGRRTAEECIGQALAATAGVLERLGEADAKEYVRIVKKIVDNAGQNNEIL